LGALVSAVEQYIHRPVYPISYNSKLIARTR
jgi:hypothetical protein